MKKLFAVFCFVLLSVFFITANASAAPGRCYNDTPCSCVNSGTPSGWCRTCTVTDDGTPATSHSMTVCGSSGAARDALACRRAVQVCNGQPITCAPNGDSGASANSAISSQCSSVNSNNTGFDFNGITFEPR